MDDLAKMTELFEKLTGLRKDYIREGGHLDIRVQMLGNFIAQSEIAIDAFERGARGK